MGRGSGGTSSPGFVSAALAFVFALACGGAIHASGFAPVPARALPLHIEGPPPGHTGGFGEPTCQTCHAEFELNMSGTLSVEGLPAAYEPGATYMVTVVLVSGDMASAGFQGAFRFAAGTDAGSSAGEVRPVDGRVAARPDSAAAVAYVQHTAEGTRPATEEETRWTFEWTAPSGASFAEAVAFHAAANSANGDSSPLGDLIYTLSVTLPAAEYSGVARHDERGLTLERRVPRP